MRAELADPALAKHAGRFVWLELNLDSPANREFVVRHAITATPTLLILDAADERVTATHLGGLALPELTRFLDVGASEAAARATSPADAALARGDASLGLGRADEAIGSYREALRAGGAEWAHRPRALAQLASALGIARDAHGAAALATSEAPRMARSPEFARVVAEGLLGAVQGDTAAWAASARATLRSLAAEAADVPALDRDTRFRIYTALANEADHRGDEQAVHRWGLRWQRELDASVPKSDDERTGLDIARVEASDFVPDPAHFVPALEASERAMPRSYVASLRLAQLLLSLHRNAEAIAACERGLTKVDGAVGRTWLLELEARALLASGDAARARAILDQARQSALAINMPANRENNLRLIASLEKEAGGPAK